MAKGTSPDYRAAERLAQIVGDSWQATADQGDALAALLQQALPARDRVALGDVWEAAVSALSVRQGPLTRASATHLLARWLRLGANRAEEWRRPRDQRPKQGRPHVRLAGDVSELVTS